MSKMAVTELGVESQQKFFKVSGWTELCLGLLLVILGFLAIPSGGRLLGLILVGGGLTSLGVMVVPEPEIWIRLRFGKAKDALHPGMHLTIPLVDTVEKKSKPYEQLIDLIPLPKGELPKINLHDGVIYLREYVVALKIGATFQHIFNAIYGEKDWVDWIRNKLNSLIVGYIRTLSVSEATDGGMLKDNLIDRIQEAAKIARKKLKTLRRSIKELKTAMGQYDPEIDVSNPILEELEKEVARIIPLPALYKKIWEELDDLIKNQAPSRGIVEITGVFIGALKLSKDLEMAREAVRIEKLKAEAALHEALQESAERIGPVIDMKNKLQAAGMTDEAEALKTALSFELVDTLSQHGGAWAVALAQGKQGEVGAIPALLMRWLATATTEKEETTAQESE